MALRCVIIDDNIEFLQNARTMLQMEGIDVVGVATSSAEALHIVSQLRPSVALVDIFLGEESGLDLARQLAERPESSPTDVILISTYGEIDLAELVAGSSAVAFLSKSRLSGSAIRETLELPDDPCEPPKAPRSAGP